MRTISRSIKIELLNFSELSDEERELIVSAVQVRKNADSPDYHWWVGAAIRSESDRIYHGCNFENVSPTQACHAEQNAVAAMVGGEGKSKILMMAIAGGPEGVDIEIVEEAETNPEAKIEDFCFACGHCLQILWGTGFVTDPGMPLLLLTSWGEVARTTIGDAFPMPFGRVNIEEEDAILSKSLAL